MFIIKDDQMLDQEYVSISQRLEQVDVANEVWIELHQELQELQELSQTLLEQVKVCNNNKFTYINII